MEFRLLKPDHVPSLKGFFAAQAYPLSPYSLSAMAMWNQCIIDTLFAVEGDIVFIAEVSREDPSQKHLLLPVGGRAPGPEELKETAARAGFKEVWYVPDSYVAAVSLPELEKHFHWAEQPEYEDYVYRVSDLAELPGRAYGKKRNLIRRFERDHAGEVEVFELSCANSQRCLQFLEDWRSERGGKGPNEILECERQAISRGLAHFELLELKGLMAAVRGRVRGFAVASRLKDDTGVLNFEKASDKIKGLYQFLDMECARRLFPGRAFINKESDMGDAGLAKAKQSYHPAMRVKSYKLTLR
ncbi:MAG: DUF2156 domain-containing protein [Elusimicrobia bacterium]|nr:DUF2156 domain-containing protein [Elusimicrobiota bacterium]